MAAIPLGVLHATPPVPQLLFDLDDTSPAPALGPYGQPSPGQLTTAGDGALFVVHRTDPYQAEVWGSDGTAAGTRPLATFCGLSDCSTAIRMLPSAGRIGLFLDEDGERLWRSDGTVAGTFPLASAGSAYGAMAIPGGRVLFSACPGSETSCELWRTDGTVAGTRRVAPVGMYAGGVVVSGVAYFAGQSELGSGLWRSDGTAAGTRLVRALGSNIQSLLAVGRNVFLMVADEYSDELWLSDGTTAGTRRVSRVPGCNDWGLCGTHVVGGAGGSLYLAFEGRLWRADAAGRLVALRAATIGSSVETARGLALALANSAGYEVAVIGPDGRRVVPLSGCPAGCPTGQQMTLMRAPGGAFITVLTTDRRLELWFSDGTGAGTTRAATLAAGAAEPWSMAASVVGERTYFGLSLGGTSALWVSDGTAAGTRRLAEGTADPALPYQGVLDLALAGGRALFGAYDSEAGYQLWSTDDTPAGTGRLLTLEARAAGSRPRAFAAVAGGVAFRACDGERTTLWWSDATPGRAPTPLLGERDGCVPAAGESVPFASGGRLFFTEPDPRADAGVRQLWTSDGTPGGTSALTTFVDQQAGEPFLLDGRVSFVVQPLAAGPASLWQSDGTAGGTAERFAFPAALFDLLEVTALGDALYFAAADAAAGLQFFATDARSGETRRITTRGPERLDPSYGMAFYPARFTRVGDDVYFALCARSGPCGLMRTRGTMESTTLAVDDCYVPYTNNPFVVFRGRLLFVGGDGLTISDGTAAGTAALGAWPGDLAVIVGDQLFFTASDDEHGEELWVSDGTAAGTLLFADLVPGPASPQARALVAAGGRLWLSAAGREHGRELWMLDQATGSASVFDLAPGAISSSPSDLTVVGDRLLFAAADAESGREPWVLPLAP